MHTPDKHCDNYQNSTILCASALDIWHQSHIIAPLSDIPMFYIKYLTMYKVHMHAGAIRQLLYGYAYVRELTNSLKLVDNLPVHTHKPYNNLNLAIQSISKTPHAIVNHCTQYELPSLILVEWICIKSHTDRF